jgi:adenylate kinase
VGLNVIMMGPPGAGKGTQAGRFARQRGLPKISTGDMLREAIKERNPVALEAKKLMDRGELVDDATIIAIVRDRLTKPDTRPGFVLDGFPRTVAQAEAAYEVARRNGITFHAVVLLEIPPEQLLDRLTARGQLTHRGDDTPETIRHRIEVYLDHTSPLIDYYRQRNILEQIDATGTIDEVAVAIEARLARVFPTRTLT